MYANMAYLQNYRVLSLMEFITKHQNKRLAHLLPRRTPSLVPIQRPNKLLEKLRSPSMGKSFLRKTISVELQKTKETKLEDIVNQKLIVSELATEKRQQQRKKAKTKVSLYKLYNVLEIRQFPLDKCSNMKQQLQQNMLQRNKHVRETVK